MTSARRHLSDYEVDRISEAMLDRGETRNYALLVLGVNTGYRISELLSLDVGDVVRPDGEWREEVRVSAMQTKTNKARHVPLNDAAQSALRKWLDEYAPEGPGLPLFPSTVGGGEYVDRPLGRGGAWAAIKRAAERAGVPAEKVGTHSLRKTFAMNVYIETGKDIRAVQLALGHSSVTVTEKYLGVAEKSVHDVIRRLNTGGDK